MIADVAGGVSELRRHLLGVDPAADFDAAARVHRRCRDRRGDAPGLVDCLVVAVAWGSGASLLAQGIGVVRSCQVLGVPVHRSAED
jgi:hypothetical protein